MARMFDDVEVVPGPLCGNYDPVVRGIEAGQRVATAGAFLLDAETRLNHGLAAGYFGAGRGERPVGPAPRTTATIVSAAAFEGLSAADRLLAERQTLCSGTNKPLGSMGTPSRVVVSGRVVFLRRDGCKDPLKQELAKYLATPSAPK
jgi:membrane fusion protein, copper/silver efflux system